MSTLYGREGGGGGRGVWDLNVLFERHVRCEDRSLAERDAVLARLEREKGHSLHGKGSRCSNISFAKGYFHHFCKRLFSAPGARLTRLGGVGEEPEQRVRARRPQARQETHPERKGRFVRLYGVRDAAYPISAG